MVELMNDKEVYKEETFQNFKLIGCFKKRITEITDNYDFLVYCVEVKQETKSDISFKEEISIEDVVAFNRATELIEKDKNLIKEDRNLNHIDNLEFAMREYTFSKAKEKIELKKYINGERIIFEPEVVEWLYEVQKILSERLKNKDK